MFSLAHKKESLIIIWDCCHMTKRTVPSSCLLARVTKWLTSGKMLAEVVGGTLLKLLFHAILFVDWHFCTLDFLFCIFIFENVIYVHMSYDNKIHPQSPQIPLYLLKMLLQSFSFLNVIPLSGAILAKEYGHRTSLGMEILQVATSSIRNDSSFSSNYPMPIAPQ